MANDGSCKIGFKPSPSSTSTEFTRNGFEVKMIKKQRRTIVIEKIERVKKIERGAKGIGKRLEETGINKWFNTLSYSV